MIGRVLSGRFTLLERIGAGTMGRVYRARQAPLGRIVAIKVLQMHQGIADDPHFKRRFFMEASLTAQLRHPNTIQIIDYGEEGEGGDEILFIAMEYLQGNTLADLLEREGRLHWTRAFSIIQQVARSLREAHGHGVIHRDLKPANLMLVHEEPGHDLVKVLDFGLVKAWRDGASVPESDLQMTQKGVILGSAFYMAPEQAHGKGDPRTDVYALGVILFHLLTGKLPYDGQTSMEVIVKHHSRPIPRLSEVATGLDVPAEVEALVRRCLAKRPDDRPQDMNVLLEQMRALAHLSDGGIRGSRSDLPALGSEPARASGVRERIEEPVGLFGSQRQDPSGDRRTLAVGVFIAAILLGVGGMFLVQRGGEPPAAPVEAPAPVTESVFLVETEPAGAKVIVDGEELGVTPLRFVRPLPTAEGELVSAEVRLSLEGYFPMTLQATSDGSAEVRVMRSLVALDPSTEAGRTRGP
ncbi:MAG TPA: serine/threonine-protein kinase [Myxococcaceae bacterium]|nr:serine/threonine-protein kinase [Myxococcaceae bacterium]